jgi:hypothetical protein
LEKQKAEFAGAGVDSPPVIAAPTAAPKPAAPATAPSSAAPAPPTEDASSAVRDLRRETAALREELSELRKIVEELGSELRARSDDFDRLKEALGA